MPRSGIPSGDRRPGLGRRAEELAAEHLRQQGYTILARNWRRPEGELDIVALAADGTCVFCEVRSRTGTSTGEPLEAISPRKRAQVIRISRVFLGELANLTLPCAPSGFRFDVIAVTFPISSCHEAELVHLPGAFETT